MTPQLEQVVFDCNVFAQAMISRRGPAHACLDLASAGQVSLVWSGYVIQEIVELAQKLPARLNITEQQVLALVRSVSEYAKFVDVVPKVYQLQADPDDSPYINLALAAGAKLIASRDRHLLCIDGLLDSGESRISPTVPGIRDSHAGTALTASA